MHDSVRAAWFDFISQHEGVVAHMYLDTRELVTIGVGNLIEPIALALELAFQWKAENKRNRQTGQAANQGEIAAEWNHLKHHPQRELLARLGYHRCRAETDLELSSPQRDQLFWRKTQTDETALKERYATWDHWPADAQMCVMAMAWGLGTGKAGLGAFTSFNAACNKQDFRSAAAECGISSWRAERNTASVTLLANAARVVSKPGDYQTSKLYYPTALHAASTA